MFPRNCPIRQHDGNGRGAGRCWYYLPDGHTCPLHGDVAFAVARYEATGTLTDETELSTGWQARARRRA